MIHLTALDTLIIEHELRTSRANRFGWLQADTAGSRRSGRFGVMLYALAAFFPAKKSSRQIEPVPTDDVAVATTSQIQGVM